MSENEDILSGEGVNGLVGKVTTNRLDISDLDPKRW